MNIKTAATRLNSPECLRLLGPIIHMSAKTSNNVRVVLRQHTKGFSRTILHNNPISGKDFWYAIEHKEYLCQELL